MWWYTWESLRYSTYVLLRTVGQDRHIGLTCVVLHKRVPGISYIGQWDGIDKRIGLTCVVVHMGGPCISYIGQWDGIDT